MDILPGEWVDRLLGVGQPAGQEPFQRNRLKEVVLRIDNDSAGLLVRRVKHNLAQISRIDVGQSQRQQSKRALWVKSGSYTL